MISPSSFTVTFRRGDRVLVSGSREGTIAEFANKYDLFHCDYILVRFHGFFKDRSRYAACTEAHYEPR